MALCSGWTRSSHRWALPASTVPVYRKSSTSPSETLFPTHAGQHELLSVIIRKPTPFIKSTHHFPSLSLPFHLQHFPLYHLVSPFNGYFRTCRQSICKRFHQTTHFHIFFLIHTDHRFRSCLCLVLSFYFFFLKDD